MICIFCLEERPDTPEHVFPEAIGGTLVIRRVCKPCNSWLGSKADAPLLDHLLVLEPRSRLGIPGKEGAVPDPIARLFGGQKWPLAADQDQHVIFIRDPQTGRPVPKLVPSERRVSLPGGGEAIQVRVDELDQEELPKIVQRLRNRAGLPPLSAPELSAVMERALASERGALENPQILITPKFDMLTYQRGMLKIAYELAWLWLGDEWLHDAAAVRLRNAIFEPNRDFTAYKVRGTVLPGADLAPLLLWQMETDCHIGHAMRIADGNQISVGVRVFSAVSAVIHATDEGWRYPDFGAGNSLGQFIALDPAERRILRHTTLSEEIQRLCSH
jgi:hypothetical protein